MNAFILSALIAFGAYLIKNSYQRKRIILLGSHLSQFQLEKLMEDLTQGYMRALGEKDLARQDQIWALMNAAEAKLCDQFNRFVADFSKLDAALTPASGYHPDWLPDLRRAELHALRGQAYRRQARYEDAYGEIGLGVALAVAAELERLKGSGVKAVLVHLEDAPRVRTLGPSRPLTQ